ncbi:uncharacterized protein LOC142223341 isoform X2 [Haematobia irritans]|uniref:uncharacterized protein LOC142223341 isoform X2 n=1 Tax=Haematobia irritans TaxID=7368 RepID=UPI003F4F86CF
MKQNTSIEVVAAALVGLGDILKYPYIVSLQEKCVTSENGEEYHFKHFCGGTLLNSNWILSAGHCLWYNPLKETSHGFVHDPSNRQGTGKNLIILDYVHCLGKAFAFNLGLRPPHYTNRRLAYPFFHILKIIMDKSTTFSQPKCRICHNRHILKDCPEFQRMNVHERRKHMKEHRFCFKCLCASHTREWCRSRKTCVVCNYNNHTMLHVDDHMRRNGRRDNKPHHESVKKNHRTATALTRTTGKRSPPKVHERLSQRPKRHIFLPTALARGLSPNGPTKVRLMLNSAGLQTFVLKSLVQRLNLRTTRKNHSEFCTLSLQSYYDPAAKIQITGIVKTQFNMALPEATSEKKLQTVYNHLPNLADPHFFKPTDIELVVGNDQLSKILLAGLI